METSTSVPIPITLRLTPPLLPIILFSLILSIHFASGADCAGQIVRFSTCLPYVSSYPNNLSSSASSSCCESISSAIGTGDGFCFCYLLRQPLVLGFPVNSTRILSLTSVCGPVNPTTFVNASLESICDGSPALPPLRSGTIGPAFTNPNSSSPDPVESGSTSTPKAMPPDVADGIPGHRLPGSQFIASGQSSRRCFACWWPLYSVVFFLWLSSHGHGISK